jgi:hypothetical protein
MINNTKYTPQVDVSHVYGEDKDSENNLRTFKDGKLKFQVCFLKQSTMTKIIDYNFAEMHVRFTNLQACSQSYLRTIKTCPKYVLGHTLSLKSVSRSLPKSGNAIN